MNKVFVGVTVVMFASLIVAVQLGLRYSQCSILFGLIAAVSAPFVIHKIDSPGTVSAVLVGLSIYASFPVKKLFQLDGFLQEVPLTFVYAGVLWVVGAGWTRAWK
jgi:hypothetical protein